MCDYIFGYPVYYDNKTVLPRFERGNGPKKSTDTSSQGILVGFKLPMLGIIVELGALLPLQMAQLFTYSPMFSLIFGQ